MKPNRKKEKIQRGEKGKEQKRKKKKKDIQRGEKGKTKKGKQKTKTEKRTQEKEREKKRKTGRGKRTEEGKRKQYVPLLGSFSDTAMHAGHDQPVPGVSLCSVLFIFFIG